MPFESTDIDPGRVREFVDSDPVVRRVAEAAGSTPIWLVGGSVRDLLLGRVPGELDFVLEGPVAEAAVTLDPAARVFETFGTAELFVDRTPVDLAQARSESYPEPGALPVVRPADLSTDLHRRDFSVNAIAFPIEPAGEITDPFDGMADLRSGVLRVLHSESFRDDPTRALRGARYCSRLGLSPDPDTLSGLQMVDLETVSADRVDRELDLVASEEDPASALELLASWGVLDIDRTVIDIAAGCFVAARVEPWNGLCSGTELIHGLLSTEVLEEADLLNRSGQPSDPWSEYRKLRSVDPVTLLIARALGAEWVDRWPSEWAHIELEITGSDLVASGVPEGPSVGAGLEAALRDQVLHGKGDRERELSVALGEASRHDPN